MSKTVLFQIIQLRKSTLFKCKYGLSKTFLFQAIQFSQTIQFSITMKGCSVFPKASELLEPHHQTVYCHNQDTRWGGLTPLQGCRRCIQQPQLTGQNSASVCVYIYIYIYIYIYMCVCVCMYLCIYPVF